MDIQDMRIFMRVAALCNLSAVGAELGLTPGTISKRIQALEDHLGARLFDRTTRRIRITEEGEIFLAHVERIMTEIADARAAVGGNVSSPKGRLNISAPASLSRRFIAPALSVFMREYPEVEIRIDLTDQIVNLYDDGYDVAIRTGALPDSTLIAKRLAPDHHVIVASPQYLAQNGVPEDPRDLVEHNCLVLGDHRQWSFSRDGQQHHIRVSGTLRSNSGDLLRHSAVDGQGIIRTSELRVLKEIGDGELIRLLPNYSVTARAAIWAVYPSAKHVLPKLRVFLDFLAEWFSKAQAANGRPKAKVTPPYDVSDRGGSQSMPVSG